MRAIDASQNGRLTGIEAGFNLLISPENLCPLEGSPQAAQSEQVEHHQAINRVSPAVRRAANS
jgi:hypothetical protein